MRVFLAITKALSDETRVRLLLALREGELCVCQLIELLELAPSTISRHLELLANAGLIERRKQGRWHYYRLADDTAPEVVRQAIEWTMDHLAQDPTARHDAQRLGSIRAKSLEELTECYRPPAIS